MDHDEPQKVIRVNRMENLGRGVRGNLGRKSPLFEDRFMQELLNYIEIGNYIPTACAAMGITESTYYSWFRHGREVHDAILGAENEQELHDALMNGAIVEGYTNYQCRCYMFAQLATKASARSESAALSLIRAQMPTQWTAAMTFLERRFPGRWKRKEQIDIGDASVDDGIDESVLLSDPEAIKLVHDALQKASANQLLPGTTEVVDAIVVEEE